MKNVVEQQSAARVSDFVEGKETEEQFVLSYQEEAVNIVKGSFGDMFCTTIGF